jgi:hypothetical protein
VTPIAIRVQIFSTPNIFVEVLNIVTVALRDISLAIANPIVNRVLFSSGKEFPVARVIT